MSPEEALKAAIRNAGGTKAMAAAITALDPIHPCSASAISQWSICPAERVQTVLEALIVARERPDPTAHDLRPDIYPDSPGRKNVSQRKTAPKPK